MLSGPPLCINDVQHLAPTQVFFPSVPHISKLVLPAPKCCISLARQITSKVLNAHAGLSYRFSSSFVRSNGTTAGCNFHISTTWVCYSVRDMNTLLSETDFFKLHMHKIRLHFIEHALLRSSRRCPGNWTFRWGLASRSVIS